MKLWNKINQKGVTLVEMVVTLGVVGILGLILVNVSRYADRQVKIQIEDVQTMILKLGASKVITRDLANATPSFNYINLADNLDSSNPRPFFVLAKNEYCQETASNICKREFKLTIPDGQIKSEPFFVITVRGFTNELLRYPRNVEKDVFMTSAPFTYRGLNDTSDPTADIRKYRIPDSPSPSPWFAKRLVMLTSNNEFYDCFNKTQTMGETGSCTPTCTAAPGTCNFIAKRELKILGVVNDNESDINFHLVNERPLLLKNKYNLCNLNKDMDCTSYIPFGPGLTTSENLFKKMPFMPGLADGAYISPVELIRYHLEKPSPNSPDHQIRLFRSVADLSGGLLKFERAHILMTGVQSMVFTRNNISNPTIEYKINKARLQQSIK
jgi:prepilin-type N-terminal cleavage/methylation domain-containing protein